MLYAPAVAVSVYANVVETALPVFAGGHTGQLPFVVDAATASGLQERWFAWPPGGDCLRRAISFVQLICHLYRRSD